MSDRMDEAYDIVSREFAKRITLKSVKVNDRLSEETTCFSATVYVDGKRVAIAKNAGRGGPNRYDPPQGGAWKKGAFKVWTEFEAAATARADELDPEGYNREAVDWAISYALELHDIRKKTSKNVMFQYLGMGPAFFQVKNQGLAELWRENPEQARNGFAAMAQARGWFSDRKLRCVGFLNDEAAGVEPPGNSKGTWYDVGPEGELIPVPGKPDLGTHPQEALL